MARVVKRIRIQLIVLGLFSTIQYSVFAGDENVLVKYSFDDQNIESGPDTFAVFEKAKGTVDISTAFPYSGYQSVEIKDVAGDRDFPELQGYFPPQKNGILYAHFAFLTTDVMEPLNIALAGPDGFTIRKNGIAFWLLTRKGYLMHYSDSIPKKLMLLTPFVWYIVNMRYDVQKGVYDLTINMEGNDVPVVSLEDQPNTPNAPDSSVDKFSFIGDLVDQSNAVYYVDDIVISTNKEVASHTIAAPGRHKLFFDYLQDYQRNLRETPVCLPLNRLPDIGIIDEQHGDLLKPDGALTALFTILAGKPTKIDQYEIDYPETHALLNSVINWKKGCHFLARNDADSAIKHFKLVEPIINGPLIKASLTMALAAKGLHSQSQLIVNDLYSVWYDDPRLSIVQAMIAVTNKDLYQAYSTLYNSAYAITENTNRVVLNKLWSGRFNRDIIETLKRKMPESWSRALDHFLMAEQYFYLLLWLDRASEAFDFADKMIVYLQEQQLTTSLWLERAGDAQFLLRDYGRAQEHYLDSIKTGSRHNSVYKKLSDIGFKTQDQEMERLYREKLYGSLH